MATSAVEICNQALSAVPARHITSLNENTKQAKHCRLLYPLVIADLLESGEWSFATRRLRLTEIATPANGWAKAFAAPADLGYPLRLLPSEFDQGLSNRGGLIYDWEGGVFWAEAEEVWLEYVVNDPSYSDMTAKFRTALVDLLAARLVMPLTGNQQREQQLMQRSEVFRDRAAANELNRNEPQNSYADGYMPDVLRWGHDL